jgi:hypothetical protein
VVRAGRAVLIAAIVVFGATPVAASATTCTGVTLSSGTCSVNGGVSGGGVDLWGDLTDGGGSTGGGTADPNECPNPVGDRCVGGPPPKDVSGPTTVHDIASFRPHAPTQFSEPSGWTLRDIPTNFISVARRHVIAGELFGNDAAVRFTPESYVRHYGDGTSKSTTTSGDTWSALGQSWWTRTATSHAFLDPSAVTVSLTVWYSAEYRFGNQDWTPLAGVVSARGNDLTFTVLDSDTVLVARSCAAGAVGCARAN